MTAKFLLPIAVVALLAITACGKKEEPVAPAAATPVAAPVAATTTPTPEDAMKAIQEQAAALSPEQKKQAVATARKVAEDAARAQSLPEEQIKQAGDMAEAATKQMLGL
jgi:hypothetical protein